jgi:pimeloyl-ACP methyl ester carboxylesterase
LKTDDKKNQVGKNIGIYGVELGAYAALSAAAADPDIKTLALDSVPLYSDDLLASVIVKRYPFAGFLTAKIAALGTYPYFRGNYKSDSLCDAAASVKDRKVLLLAGVDVPSFRNSTVELGKCFTFQIESKTDLSISGFGVIGAGGEQSEAYEQRVIEFFKKALSNNSET